jgi:hypothetical protein
VPLLFNEALVPGIEIGDFDERALIHVDVVRGFRPQTEIRIFIFVFDLGSLEGEIRVFEFARLIMDTETGL